MPHRQGWGGLACKVLAILFSLDLMIAELNALQMENVKEGLRDTTGPTLQRRSS